MVKKTSSSSSFWPWGVCNHPKTLSFRANNTNLDMFKTMNNVYMNTPDPSCSSMSSKTIMEEHENRDDEAEESIEKVIKGLISSQRLVFEVIGETSSILEQVSTNKKGVGLFKESVAMEMESRDPFVDFRKSMEEMMEANHVKNDNWDFLEELLACYLKVNNKSNHGYIVGAFVDLLVSLELTSTINNNNNNNNNIDCLSPSTSSEDQGGCSSSSIVGGDHSFTSPLSFYYSSPSSTISPCLSSLMEFEAEIEKSEENSYKSSSMILTNV